MDYEALLLEIYSYLDCLCVLKFRVNYLQQPLAGEANLLEASSQIADGPLFLVVHYFILILNLNIKSAYKCRIFLFSTIYGKTCVEANQRRDRI